MMIAYGLKNITGIVNAVNRILPKSISRMSALVWREGIRLKASTRNLKDRAYLLSPFAVDVCARL